MESIPAIVARAGPCSIQAEDIFGPQVKGCLDYFDFTLLFEEYIITIPFTALLLLATVSRIRYLFGTSEKVNGGVHHFSKFVGMAVLAAAQLALLIFWARPSTPKTRCTLPAAALTVALSLLSVLLSHLEHKRSIRPSAILVVSLMFCVLFDIARARTLWSIARNTPVAVLFSVTLGIKILLLFLEALGKRRLLKPMYKDSSSESTSGIIGQNLFWWLHPLLRRGYSVVISMNDLMTLDEDFTSDSSKRSGLSLQLEKVSKHRTTHALLIALFKYYKWPIMAGILPRVAQIGFFFAQPYIVGAFTTFISAKDRSQNQGYGLIGAFALVYVGIAISTTTAQHKVFRFIAMLRGSLVELIYRKTMAIETKAIQESTPLTLMSADIERISTGLALLHDFWASILQIPLALYLLWRELGVASMAPLGVAILSMIGAVSISSLAGERQAVWLRAIESRVDATAQMLGTMKGVKMTGLTDKILIMIQKQREEEITKSQSFRKLLIAMVGISFANLAISPVICFTIYTVLAKRDETATLTTTKAFTSLVLFNNLAMPITGLVQSVTGLAIAVGSIERINQFLLKTPRQDRRSHNSFKSSETLARDADDTEKISKKRNSSEYLLFDSRDTSSGWSKEKPSTVSGLTFQIQASSLTMVVGPVGCGKSTFVNTLLGETPIFDGFLEVNTSVSAYCSQECWLKNDTVQNNILGETQFDLKWYNRVLWACALDQDIMEFPQGDQALVGSKGAVLSGGQKQRLVWAPSSRSIWQ